MKIDLAKEITKTLKQYTTEVTEGIEEIKDDLAQEAVKKLKSGGPYKERTGKYSKSWSVKKVKSDRTIFNRKHYQLTHLLEYGHASRNGGRVAARPHIEDVESYVVEQFEKRVEDLLG